MIYEDALSAVRRYVAEAFKAGTSTFPHYTLHGAEHLEELDRLALLIGDFIPSLSKERLNLLRLAIVLHDFAMVDVPDAAREQELRRQMGSDLSFADIVRKVHQDEIERSFTKPERIALLLGLIPTAGTQDLEDACTIARHHRFHPLNKSPEHVRDLCALMRILDELDIGPKRAPLPAYEALRPQMDVTSRFHWLKHICTRALDRHGTLSVEERNHRRVLKVFIAVKATGLTWRPIQEIVSSKLRECLDQEGVNDVLRSTLHIEFELAPAPEPEFSGATLFLATSVREDLESIPAEFFGSKTAIPVGLPKSQPPAAPLGPALISFISERSARDFKIVAIPPETLAKTLCISGRLTVIDNLYVPPEEKNAGGIPDAPNRIYIGPADSGKTRAALEWVNHLTEDSSNQWVVLRTGMGSLPESIENIILDTSYYETRGFIQPQKAVLFLDDLPMNFPPATASFSAPEAVRLLFHWFHELAYFRERRVVGTLRIEDLYSQPEWPAILPSLGTSLELRRLMPLNANEYRRLWRGMTNGLLSRSVTEGISMFHMEFSQEFMDNVAQRPSDPEAVAVFVQQNAIKSRTVLSLSDAENFSTSAVKTWVRETFPALVNSYGVAIKIFFTLARMLDSGSRHLKTSWQAHLSLGPDLCKFAGGVPDAYPYLLKTIIENGHAVGEEGLWIRPRFDFILQASDLAEVELKLPSVEWFIVRLPRLDFETRTKVARYFAGLGTQVSAQEPCWKDSGWLTGWGSGLLDRGLYLLPKEKADLYENASEFFQVALELNPDNPMALINYAYILMQGFDEANFSSRHEYHDKIVELSRRATDVAPHISSTWTYLGCSYLNKSYLLSGADGEIYLLEEAIASFREGLEVDPAELEYSGVSFLRALLRRGILEDDSDRRYEMLSEPMALMGEPSLRRNVDGLMALGHGLYHYAIKEVEESLQQRELIDGSINSFLAGLAILPESFWLWYHLGTSQAFKALKENDPKRKKELLMDAVSSHRKAVAIDPASFLAWLEIGYNLDKISKIETAAQGGPKQLIEDKLIAFRKSSEINPKSSEAWFMTGVSLDDLSSFEPDPNVRDGLRAEQVAAFRNVTKLNDQSFLGWIHLSESLLQRAEADLNPEISMQFCREAVDTARTAIKIASNDLDAWQTLFCSLTEYARKANTHESYEEAIVAAKMVRSFGEDRYNLACILALANKHDEALAELQACLENGEVSLKEVQEDEDWSKLRLDNRFQEILRRASLLAGEPPAQ